MMKTIKDVAKTTASKVNLNETEVHAVLDLFFKETRNKVEKHDNIEIYLYGLGSYVAKKRKIEQLIKYYEVKKARVLDKTSIKETTKQIIIAECDDKLAQLIDLQKKYALKDEARKQFKQVKSGKTIGSLSESKGNMDGSAE